MFIVWDLIRIRNLLSFHLRNAGGNNLLLIHIKIHCYWMPKASHTVTMYYPGKKGAEKEKA
jgi:hypothetical protein